MRFGDFHHVLGIIWGATVAQGRQLYYQDFSNLLEIEFSVVFLSFFFFSPSNLSSMSVEFQFKLIQFIS